MSAVAFLWLAEHKNFMSGSRESFVVAIITDLFFQNHFHLIADFEA